MQEKKTSTETIVYAAALVDGTYDAVITRPIPRYLAYPHYFAGDARRAENLGCRAS